VERVWREPAPNHRADWLTDDSPDMSPKSDGREGVKIENESALAIDGKRKRDRSVAGRVFWHPGVAIVVFR